MSARTGLDRSPPAAATLPPELATTQKRFRLLEAMANNQGLAMEHILPLSSLPLSACAPKSRRYLQPMYDEGRFPYKSVPVSVYGNPEEDWCD